MYENVKYNLRFILFLGYYYFLLNPRPTKSYASLGSFDTNKYIFLNFLKKLYFF